MSSNNEPEEIQPKGESLVKYCAICGVELEDTVLTNRYWKCLSCESIFQVKVRAETQMNKSRVARDLWRKVFNDNIIDLKDGDARKQVVSEFLADPVNIKAGWKKKDARFMRLGFQKVAKEQGVNVMNLGLNPTPIRSKLKRVH